MTSTDRTTEIGLREGYALWAKTYDTTPNALIAVEELHVDALLAGISHDSVLDVGTGTGRYALRLARRGAHVAAVDPSPEILAIARRAAQGEHLDIDFAVGSLGGGLPFASGVFDLAVCALVLCHIPDLDSAVRALHRVTRPGGHVLLTDFQPDAHAFGWRSWFINEGTRYAVPNIAHSREDYLSALGAAGYRLRQVLDIPVGAVPADYIGEDVQREHADLNFCLVVLAERQ